jgi:condensin complex subunit 2
LQVTAEASTTETEESLTQAREFSSVISNLRTNYTDDKMSEISTSFCFICLLHLANEQGLKIEVDSQGKLETTSEGEEVRAEEVGNLEALKVWKVRQGQNQCV